MSDNNFIKEFGGTLKSWADEFAQKQDMPADRWLLGKMQSALADVPGADAAAVCGEITAGIEKYEKNRQDIQAAFENGISKEEWLSGKLQESTAGMESREQAEALGMLYGGLAESAGIEIQAGEQDGKHEYELEGSMLANSAGEMAVARAMQVFGENDGAEIEEDMGLSEYIEDSLKRGAGRELKKIASGTLVSIVKKGRIPLIPPSTPVGLVTHIACFGIDHASTILKIARKEISLTEGLRIISQNAVSAIFGMVSDLSGRLSRDGIAGAVPFLKKPLSYVNKISNAVLNFAGGQEIKEKAAEAVRKVAPVAAGFAREMVSAAVSTVKRVASKIAGFLFR